MLVIITFVHAMAFDTFKYVYTVDSRSPFTLPMPIISNEGLKPLPGRTYFNPLKSSVLLAAGSWWPNWLQGKPRTLRFLSYLMYAFNWWY